MSERRRYRITGVVQGVGFRWWTRKTADDMDLRGTVRNTRDGSVEVEVEGDPEAVDRFEQALSQGPRSARVQQLQRLEPGTDALPIAFQILH